MKRFLKIFFYICLFLSLVNAQTDKIHFEDIVKAFNAFEYRQVIDKSISILQNKSKLAQIHKLELLRMKAISHYILSEEDMAVLSFVEILKTEPHYRLDPLYNSPKLIAFFKNVKENYTPDPKPQKSVDNPPSSLNKPDLRIIKNSVLRSLALPGWGHVYAGQRSKGFFFLGASAVGLSSAFYFAVKTNRLERDYLNETNALKIEARYNSYNQAYRWRNGLAVTYALLWIYSQADLSFRLFDSPTNGLSLKLNADALQMRLNYSF